ncbi:hypothetical protein [Alkalihalobacillus sp. BA299]|uniref:hypothetical protein n=1 Tax=Alkalihalobacillus sp. BA299 TaxID=2815938 RepID=UPI001AD980A6|nr:hypothetical protein [Alkalihalobacillus sp. BA299]
MDDRRPKAWKNVLKEVTKAIEHTNSAPNEAVATSIFMRRYGFFIVASGVMYYGCMDKQTPNKLFVVRQQ